MMSKEIALVCQIDSMTPLKVLQRALDKILTPSSPFPTSDFANPDEGRANEQQEGDSTFPKESLRNITAARADNAEVPVYLWDMMVAPLLDPPLCNH